MFYLKSLLSSHLFPLQTQPVCLPLKKETYDSLSDEEKQRVIFGFVDPNNTTERPSSSTTTTPMTASGVHGSIQEPHDQAIL